jgi:hypothetical protein
MSRGTSRLEKNSLRASMLPYALLVRASTSVESQRQAMMVEPRYMIECVKWKYAFFFQVDLCSCWDWFLS